MVSSTFRLIGLIAVGVSGNWAANLGKRRNLAHQKRSDFYDLRLRCPSRTPEIAQCLTEDKAMLHCDFRVRWKVASDLRFGAAISEPETPSFCGISRDLAPSAQKSLAIAIVRFRCAKRTEISYQNNLSVSRVRKGGRRQGGPRHKLS